MKINTDEVKINGHMEKMQKENELHSKNSVWKWNEIGLAAMYIEDALRNNNDREDVVKPIAYRLALRLKFTTEEITTLIQNYLAGKKDYDYKLYGITINDWMEQFKQPYPEAILTAYLMSANKDEINKYGIDYPISIDRNTLNEKEIEKINKFSNDFKFTNQQNLIDKARPFYNKFLNILDDDKSEKLEFRYNHYYKLKLNKQEDYWQGKLMLHGGAIDSNLYFEINKNNLEILNVFDESLRSDIESYNETMQTDFDDKKALIKGITQIVALAQDECNLTPKNIIINPISIYDEKNSIDDFRKIFNDIDNINTNGVLNKTYELSYPIDNKIVNSLKEYEILNNAKDMLSKIMDGSIIADDIDKDLLNEVYKIQRDPYPFNFNSFTNEQVIKLFKEEFKDNKYYKCRTNGLTANSISGIFYNDRLTKLIDKAINKETLNKNDDFVR